MSTVVELNHRHSQLSEQNSVPTVPPNDGKALERIANVLKEYQSINNCNDDESKISQSIIQYMNNIQYTNLVNDYQHVLTCYSKDFDIIHKSINNQFVCELEVCKSYHRNSRDTSAHQSFDQANFYIDILDNIHTYFVHGYDTGFRIKIKDSINPRVLSLLLKEKHIGFKKIRGQNIVLQNKFYTHISKEIGAPQTQYIDLKDIDEHFLPLEEIKYEQESDEVAIDQYSFGHRFYYWDYYKNKNESDPFNPGYKYKDWYITKKYDTMRTEILNEIDVNRYNDTRNKAMQLLKLSDKLMAIQSRQISEYKIDMKQPLSIDHLMSIIFYTDYSQLSSKFSATFRKTPSESDHSMKKRNSAYWNWSKLLITTVHAYGTALNCSWSWKDESIEQLYHGISFMYFTSWAARFCAPTSTTGIFEVAQMFAVEGLVVALENCPDDHPFYFNASLVSRFGLEDERLFIGGYGNGITNAGVLRIVGLRNMISEDDYSRTIRELSGFDLLISGKLYSRFDGRFIYHLIKGTSGYPVDDYPDYVVETFRRFTRSKTFIKINLHDLFRKAHSDIISLFIEPFGRYKDRLIQFEEICKIFPNCKEIECNMFGEGQISTSYFSGLVDQLIRMDRQILNQLQTVKLTNITHSIMINTAPFLEHLQQRNATSNWHCSHQISQLIFTKKNSTQSQSKEFTSQQKAGSTTIHEREIVRELIVTNSARWIVSDSIAMLLHNICYYVFAITIFKTNGFGSIIYFLAWVSIILCVFESILLVFQSCVLGGIINVHLLVAIPDVQILLEYSVNLPMMIIQFYYLYNVLLDDVIYSIAICECIAFMAYIVYVLYRIMIIYCHHYATFKYYANWKMRNAWKTVIKCQFISWIICVPAIMIIFGAVFLLTSEASQLSFVFIMIGSYIFIISSAAAMLLRSNKGNCTRPQCVCQCCKIPDAESDPDCDRGSEHGSDYELRLMDSNYLIGVRNLFTMNIVGMLLHNIFYYVFAINLFIDFTNSENDQTLLWLTTVTFLLCVMETILGLIGILQLLIRLFGCDGFECCDLRFTASILQFLLEYFINLPMIGCMSYYVYYTQWNNDIGDSNIYLYIAFGSYTLHNIYKVCLMVYTYKNRMYEEGTKFDNIIVNAVNWLVIVPIIFFIFGAIFIGNGNNDYTISLVFLIVGATVSVCACVLFALIIKPVFNYYFNI